MTKQRAIRFVCESLGLDYDSLSDPVYAINLRVKESKNVDIGFDDDSMSIYKRYDDWRFFSMGITYDSLLLYLTKEESIERIYDMIICVDEWYKRICCEDNV